MDGHVIKSRKKVMSIINSLNKLDFLRGFKEFMLTIVEARTVHGQCLHIDHYWENEMEYLKSPTRFYLSTNSLVVEIST